MKNFSYMNAPTLDAAIDILDRLGEKAWPVAGGSNVTVFIRSGKRNDKTLVNIRGISELRGISEENGVVSIGALTTINDLAGSEILKVNAPGLYSVASLFADPITRNSATIGGNVCNATAGGDTIPSLLVLDAVAHAVSRAGKREIKLSELFTRPGRTCLQPNELVTHFSFRAAPNTAAIKLGQRKAMSIAMATVAAYVDMDGAVIRDCRIALGAVAPTPVRAYNAEKAVIGKQLDEACFAALAEAIQSDMNPRNPSVRATVSYRRAVVPTLVKRAMKLAATGECM